MKKIVFIIMLTITTIVNAQNNEVNVAIDAFFDAFHARDTVKLKSICADNLILQSVFEGKNRNLFTTESKQDFFKSLVGIPDKMNFKEKIINMNTQIDGSMANVWMRYEFYIDNKLQHCGVNSFQLVKKDTIWQIVYIMDTRRRICS